MCDKQLIIAAIIAVFCEHVNVQGNDNCRRVTYQVANMNQVN